MKACPKCLSPGPFYTDTSKTSGLSSWCIACDKRRPRPSKARPFVPCDKCGRPRGPRRKRFCVECAEKERVTDKRFLRRQRQVAGLCAFCERPREPGHKWECRQCTA